MLSMLGVPPSGQIIMRQINQKVGHAASFTFKHLRPEVRKSSLVQKEHLHGVV